MDIYGYIYEWVCIYIDIFLWLLLHHELFLLVRILSIPIQSLTHAVTSSAWPQCPNVDTRTLWDVNKCLAKVEANDIHCFLPVHQPSYVFAEDKVSWTCLALVNPCLWFPGIFLSFIFSETCSKGTGIREKCRAGEYKKSYLTFYTFPISDTFQLRGFLNQNFYLFINEPWNIPSPIKCL